MKKNKLPALTKEEENALVARAAKGGKAAVCELFARYEGLLMRACKGYLRMEELREDALSIVRLAFFEAILDFDPKNGAYFGSFAKMRTTSALYAEFRRARKRWERELRPDQTETAAKFWEELTENHAYPSPEEAVAKRLALASAIRMLSPAEKEILRRIFFERETLEKIAKRLHKTRQNIGQAKKTILAKLKAFLSADTGELAVLL